LGLPNAAKDSDKPVNAESEGDTHMTDKGKQFFEKGHRSIELISGAAGRYQPQEFITGYDPSKGWHIPISDEDMESLKAGPDDEWYWDAWNNLLNVAEYTHEDGTKYCLTQSEICGSLYMVPQGTDLEDFAEWRTQA
jgi:hypothetical protein